MPSLFALAALLLMAVPHVACADDEATPSTTKPVVIIETSAGTIEAELWPAAAPKTVDVFVGLAEGTREWTELKTGAKKTAPFYDGLIFHRIIKNFMLQGGCPNGNGSGGPGFSYPDEINAKGLGLDKEKLFPNGPQGNPHMAILGVLGRTPQQQQATFQRTIIVPLLKKLSITLADANKRVGEWQPKLLYLSL